MSEALKLHLAQAENRIRYSLSFATGNDFDEESRVQAMTAFYKWVGVANDEGNY